MNVIEKVAAVISDIDWDGIKSKETREYEIFKARAAVEVVLSHLWDKAPTWPDSGPMLNDFERELEKE